MSTTNKLQVLTVFLLVVITIYLFVIEASGSVLLDFSVYYEAGQRVASGLNAYDHVYIKQSHDHKTFHLSYFYPPFLAYVLSKLTAVEYNTLKFVWCLINYIAVMLSAYGLTMLAEMFYKSKRGHVLRFLLIFFFLISFKPLYWGLRHGQVDALILCLLVYTVFFAYLGRYRSSGVVLGIAALIKMSPALLLLSALKFRRIQTLVGFFGTCTIATILLLFADDGSRMLGDFFAQFGKLSSGNIDRRMVFNFALDKAFLRPFGLDELLAVRWTFKIALLTLPILAILTFSKNDKISELRAHSLLICLMILVSPMIWFHHFVWAFIPLTILLGLDNAEGDTRYKKWFACLAIYFVLSQSFLFHYHAYTSDPRLQQLTIFIPISALALLTILLLKAKEDSS